MWKIRRASEIPSKLGPTTEIDPPHTLGPGFYPKMYNNLLQPRKSDTLACPEKSKYVDQEKSAEHLERFIVSLSNNGMGRWLSMIYTPS